MTGGIDPAGWRPVPDPTILTTEALMREVGALREYIDVRLEAQAKEHAIFTQTARDARASLEAECEASINSLKIITDERITGIRRQIHDLNSLVETRFTALEARAAEQKQDTKIAVDAAFLAARDAVAAQAESSSKAIDKAELSTSQKIASIETIIANGNAAILTRVDDLKERVDRSEGTGAGAERQARLYGSGIVGLIALGGLVVAAVKL